MTTSPDVPHLAALLGGHLPRRRAGRPLGDAPHDAGRRPAAEDERCAWQRVLDDVARPADLELLVRLPGLLGQPSPRDRGRSGATRLRRNRVALEGARSLCRAAGNAGVPVTIAAGPRTDVAHLLGVVRELRQDFPSTGVLLHAGVRRTEDDCATLVAEGVRVRLASGRPRAATDPVHATALEQDKAFVRCLKVLLGGPVAPVVETGDERLLRIARALAARAGRPEDGWELAVPAAPRARVRGGWPGRGCGDGAPTPRLRPTLVASPGERAAGGPPAGRGAVRRLASASGDLTQFARSLAPRRR